MRSGHSVSLALDGGQGLRGFVGRLVGRLVGALLIGATPFAYLSLASWNVADKPKELCLSATQVLANGEESPESEAACAEVQRASGCSSAGGAGGAVSLSLLGLLLMGRRRR